jgi:predicted nucleotidyltransferase
MTHNPPGTPPTPYPDLNTVLHDLVTGIQSVLGDNFAGLYLQGSFAVGDFDAYSDVDFIVAIREDLTAEMVTTLNALHERIYDIPIEWAKHLEGSYFPLDILRDYSRSGSEVWYLDHGWRHLERSNHCNTLLVRSVVRENGVTLAGPPPQSLVNPIPVGALRREMLAVINDWGREILADPEHYRNRFYQGFIVLSYCRMLHDLLNGFPGSKRAGAEWAKANLDPAWSGLIDRTWACRPDPAVSVRTRPDPADFEATLAFVTCITGQANAFATENSTLFAV